MDVRYINPFIGSIRDVFKTMAEVEVQVLKPTIELKGKRADVSGVIGFSGEVVGACVLCFPSDVACKLASAFAGEEMSVEHPDFTDAIGELTNMVAGNAKSQFSGLSVDISLPTVVIGKQHDITVTGVPSDVQRLIIPCQTDFGTFHLEAAMVVPAEAGRQGAGATHSAGVKS